MNSAPPHRAIETVHGTYVVEGLARFAVGGDLAAEIAAAVAGHHARTGRPPAAVTWDDAVLNFRARHLSLGLTRVDVPAADSLLGAQLDSAGRAAVRGDLIGDGPHRTSAALAALAGTDGIAHAGGLVRMIGWPSAAPLLDAPPPEPSARAQAISVVVNYRNRSSITVSCLLALRRQVRAARLEILLVDNQSRGPERHVVEVAARQLFGADPTATVIHLDHDEAFNHSAQCNRAAARATGDVLVMLSNDCVLLDADILQAMADRALAPGVAAVGPLLVDGDGLVSGTGMAIGPRRVDDPELHLHEAEVPYLSTLVRRSNGASFACAAIARGVWARLGGLKADAFPTDYNDADFCLRAAAAGLACLHLGTHRARHSAGLADLRSRDRARDLHAGLAARHDLAAVPRLNPTALPIKTYPPFVSPDATRLCDYVRLYRRALDHRRSGAALDAGLETAFRRLGKVAHEARGHGVARPNFTNRIDAALRAVCAAFIDARPEEIPDRYHKSFRRLERAFITLRTEAERPAVPMAEAAVIAETLPTSSEHQPAGPSPAAGRPAPDVQFASHADAATGRTRHRLLVFADAYGPSQRILFVEALKAARARGEVAVRIVTEEDLQNLASLRGQEALGAWLRATVAAVAPTAIVWSRFADAAFIPAIEAAAAGWPAVPRVVHIDDDLFSLPATIGVERYREARHPRRIHALSATIEGADLVLASTPALARQLAGLFGPVAITLCPMHEGGAPFASRPRPGPPVIGYFGSATHDRDLGLVAPALRRLKVERPDVTIEIVGSVARRIAAVELGDTVTRRPELEPDYPRFREAMRGWGWTLGLAPLVAHPFNAAKTPVKWTEYAQAGIPVIASRTEPYLELGRRGALALAAPDEWHGRIAELLAQPSRAAGLVAVSDRLLRGFDEWGVMERRLLGLLARAAALSGASQQRA